MNIALTFNVRHVKPDINNPQYIAEAEFDEPATIEGVAKALESLGHIVYQVEADEEAYGKFRALKGKIDIVFNMAEGLRGEDREAQIPAMLEMLGIPYTGPKPLGYAVGLNKSVAKELLSFYKIPTPRWMTIEKIEDMEKKPVDFFPAIAKPLSEGSSKGICARNLVSDADGLKKIIVELLEKYHQPVLVEEYLDGREFTVAVLGAPPRVLPIIEVTFNDLPAGMPKFDHYEAKWFYDSPDKKADPLVCPAVLSAELKSQIDKTCLDAFDALEMADWARFDLRLDKNGIPNILEVNCPPGIMPDPKENSRFPRAAREAGYSFEQMLEEILKSACKRYNIQYNCHSRESGNPVANLP